MLLYKDRIPCTKDVKVASETKEDVFRHSKASREIRDLLSHWNEQHDYVGPSWDGVIKFHRKLVQGTMVAAFETAGWYKYKSSTKTEGMDGKDWRVILTGFEPLVVVNCHSCINEGVWTLATMVFNSTEIDRSKLKPISDDNPERCALLWSIEVAHILETSGYDYTDALKKMKDKLSKI